MLIYIEVLIFFGLIGLFAIPVHLYLERAKKKYGDKWEEGLAWEAKNPWWLRWLKKGGKR